MRLSDLARGRDNNFNLIRILAAIAVLVTHGFVLATGRSDVEPLRAQLGTTLGLIAVDVFFVTSGFLVTGSLLTRRSLLDFIWARVLRIYPALILMVLLTVFALGPLFTSWPLEEYFAHRVTRLYLAKTSTLFAGVAYMLPGVFETNPYPRAVNGSLWTMPYEVRMYAILAATWALLRLLPNFTARVFQSVVLLFTALGAIGAVAVHFLLPVDPQYPRLFFMFFTGASVYVLKERLALNRAPFALCVTVLAASTLNRHAFAVAYLFTLPYIVFYLAYVPGGPVRAYNRLGDYSYGFYIYAFPVQQMVAALVPGITPGGMIALAGAATLALAALSWHGIERRALGVKSRCADATRRWFRKGVVV